MPGRHHRGVDRTVAILEAVAHAPDGLTLTRLATVIDAPVSSTQQLVNGLVAVGYLSSDAGQFTLGPGAFALTMGSDWSSVAPISHELIVRLSKRLDCTIVLGVLVGDNLMYFDEAGNDPALDYYARTRQRRPILRSSGGKRLLAGLPDELLQRRLRELSTSHPSEEIDAFLQELPEIRRTGLAYGDQVTNIVAVAAGVPGRRGQLAAALIAVGTPEFMRDRWQDMGQVLLDEIEQAR